MPARPPSLRAIAAFEAAARHQSFAKAAQELNLSHGAISHAIRGLEARLGQQLFDRTGRSVSLTEDGRLLAARVRLSLSLLADAFDVSPWLRSSGLIISVLHSFAQKFLIARLQGFYDREPGAQLQLRCTPTVADLEGGEIDLGIRFGPGRWAGLQSRHLADEWLFPVASPAYRCGELRGGWRTSRPAGSSSIRRARGRCGSIPSTCHKRSAPHPSGSTTRR
jgi:LysR family transcriptional regulator, glycine cleavage system transcriptional activator